MLSIPYSHLIACARIYRYLQGFSDDSVLYNEESEFQSILVFRSAQHGNVLALDGVIRKFYTTMFAAVKWTRPLWYNLYGSFYYFPQPSSHIQFTIFMF